MVANLRHSAAPSGVAPRRFTATLAVVVLILVSAALYCVSSAAAESVGMVVGADFSTRSGSVVVNARATGPMSEATLSAPAVGFIKVSDNPAWRNFRGAVTCIGSPGGAAVVSGVLEQPFASGGLTLPNFTFLILPPDSLGNQYGIIFIDNLSFFLGDPCGVALNFQAGTPWDGFTDPTPFKFLRGNFILH